MGHWTNSAAQTLSAASGAVTIVDFDTEIAPGSQTATQDGLYDYSYHLNLLKPSGELGPSRVTSVLAVRREVGGTDTIRESRSFVEIDSGAEEALSHTGRLPMSSGDMVIVRVNLDDPTQTGDLMTRLKQRQCTLTFDLVGAVPSGNFSGTEFPTGRLLNPGYTFYRTDLSEEFKWNGSKWLGELRADGAGRNGNLTGASYLRRYNGMLMDADEGIFIPWDATVTCFSWTRRAGLVAGNFEIRRDGVPIATIDGSAQGGGVDLDIDFAAGGVLSIFWNSGLTISDVQVSIHYRRRG